MKAEIEIPEGKKAVWSGGVLKLIDISKGDITERVRSFDDAARELGEDHPDVVLFRKLDKEENELPKDVRAYLMLRIITAALNEGWKPTFEVNEYRFFPWFGTAYGERGEVAANGKITITSEYSRACAGLCSRIAYKTSELAKYSGLKFKRIWEDYLLMK